MRSSIRFGRVFGIEIGAHLSWLIILALVVLSLSAHFAVTQPAWPRALRWTAASVTAALFFAAVVAHELSHSLVARRFGVGVRAITLFLFGGVAELENDSRRPSDEFWIAAAGPISSLAIAGLFAGVGAVTAADSVPGAVARWLARINLALALFNLLPAFPLDGGRVLRGLVWWRTGDQRRATRVAALAGRALAMLMILGGIWTFFFVGAGLGGLWIAFLGWFLLDAARAGEAQVEMRHALRGVTAADIMTRDWPRVPAVLTLDRFVAEHLLPTGRRCFLVNEGERIVGLVTASDLQAIDRDRWGALAIRDAMRPLDRLHAVEPTTGADRVLEIMGREEVNQLPVMDGGRLQGIVSREHLIRMLTTRMEFAG